MQVIDHRVSGSVPVPMEPGVVRPAGGEELSARIALLQVSAVRVDAVVMSPHSFDGGPDADDHASLLVAWVREGRVLASSGDTAFEVLPGEALLWDTRRALQCRIEGDLRLVRVIVDLAQLHENPSLAVPRPIAVLRGSPLVRSALAFVGTLLQESRRAEPEDDDQVVAHTMIALVHGLVAEMEHQRRRTARDDHRDRRTAIEAHIAFRLGDPDLGPVSIGRDFGISVRSVHAAFLGSGTTVAAEIRIRRIAAVQATLRGRAALPRMAELAVQHGFRDTSQLSRTFRDLTGMPVRDWWALHHRTASGSLT